MNKIPCLIISFNRLTFLRKQLEALTKNPRLDIIIIDNNSTYEPLLSFYQGISSDIHIHYMDGNYGHSVPFTHGLTKLYCGDGAYIVSDCDIIPPLRRSDYVEVLEAGLEAFKDVRKIGLGLNTSDIPYTYPRYKEVIAHERKVLYREATENERYVRMPVDTTFALYRGGYHDYSVWGTKDNIWTERCYSLRTTKPYEATHLGWHITNKTEEDIFYFESIKKQASGQWRI